MSGRLKRRIVIAAVVLGVAVLGGTALATSSSGGNSFVTDVAHRLGIAPAKLQSAINGALADRLDQLVKQGKLTRAQANAIEKRLQQRGGVMPFMGPVGPFGGFAHHRFGGGPRPFFGLRPMGPLAPAASYLGISQAALFKDLRSGKTLAAIAKANGESVAGLEAAMIAQAKSHLDAAVKAGRLTKSQEGRLLKMLSHGIDQMVTNGAHFGIGFGGPMRHGWDGDRDGGAMNGKIAAPMAF